MVNTDLQQLQIVQIQWALRSSSLHHVQVVKALLSIAWKTHSNPQSAQTLAKHKEASAHSSNFDSIYQIPYKKTFNSLE